MIDQHIAKELQIIIAHKIEPGFSISHTEALGGGCINHAYRIAGDQQSYFIKLNDPQWIANFQAEYAGLRQLAASNTVRVPLPLAVTVAAGRALLIMEYLPLTRPASVSDPSALWRRMGGELARLHDTPIADINAALRASDTRSAAALRDSDTSSGAAPLPSEPPLLLPEDGFGGRIANSTLGNRPGYLGVNGNWADFFVRNRLQFQFEQARQLHGTQFHGEERVLTVCRTLLSPPHHHPAPSLTHGDLWGGNASFAAAAGNHGSGGGVFPVVFDPAPYIADGETDLALSELFGGFPPAFYDGYQAQRPLPAGYQQRRTIYNLYHVLNHYNLFGGGYRHQSQAMIEEICRYAK